MSNDYSAGTLTVGVKADTNPLSKGLDKGRKDVKGFAVGVDKELSDGFSKTFSKLAGIAAGFFAVDKITGFIGSTLESIDDLGKQADKLRVSAEQLQAYQYAANLADVETSTLNSAIQKMTLNLSAANEESGPALDWLSKMGLSAKQLQQTDVGSAFERIGAALERLPEADRLKAVSDIFGKGNTDLVNLFAEGLGKSVAEFEKLGLAVSSEEVARVKEFNDSWEKLSKSFGAVGRDFVIDISPFALAAIDDIREALGMIGAADNESKDGSMAAQLSRNKYFAGGVGGIMPGFIMDLTAQAFMGNTGLTSQRETILAQQAMEAQQRARGINVDGITRQQGDAQIGVLGQIRDAVRSNRPTQTIELKPAGAL